jgi:hypothetical protein
MTGPTVRPGLVEIHKGSVSSVALIDEIIGHLGAAISQSIPSDDQIIMEHVRAAHGLARILRRAA